MANEPISGLPALAAADLASGDLIEIVDVSDTSDAPTGTNKKFASSDLATGIVALPDFATSIYASPQEAHTTQTVNFTPDLTMQGKFIPLDSAVARTVTFDDDVAVPYPLGIWLWFKDEGTARWTFDPGPATFNDQPNVVGNPVTLGANSLVGFYHRDVDMWDYFGSVRTRELKSYPWRVTDLTTTLTTLAVGDDKERFYIPAPVNGLNLVDARLLLKTPSSSGLPTFQIARVRAGVAVDVFDPAHKLSCDVSELTSVTASNPVQINTANDDVETDDYYRADLDITGTGAVGATIMLDFA